MSKRAAELLLVEDDEVDVMFVRRTFEKLGVTNAIHRARDGVEALAFLREPGRIPRPVVVLLDLNLPRMNGIEFLQELRKDPALQQLVVFVLTTSSAHEDKSAAYLRNVAGYVVKSEGDSSFQQVVTLLRDYWNVVELPDV